FLPIASLLSGGQVRCTRWSVLTQLTGLVGAITQYVLQRYQIDTTKVHAKATAQQIVVVNLDELQGWLYH
ncbi:TPA: hypothetical protein ACHIWJ_005193, partial [Pseudomonas aeruginosa]